MPYQHLPAALTVGLDVDNVLYPFSSIFTRWAEAYRGLPPGTLNDEAKSWPWYRDEWGWTTQDFLDVYAAGVRGGIIFTKGDATPGSVHAATAILNRGHRIAYVTDRTPPGVTADEAKFLTAKWLEREGFPFASQVFVTADKTSVPTDVFLDDRPENVEALNAAGTVAVLWRMRHNRHAWGRGRSAGTWEQFLRYVDLVAARKDREAREDLAAHRRLAPL